MSVTLTVVHDGRGHVLSGHTLGPGGADVQVQLRLSTILTGIFLQRKIMAIFKVFLNKHLIPSARILITIEVSINVSTIPQPMLPVGPLSLGEDSSKKREKIEKGCFEDDQV
jgi:hypothetical protein